jgi:hypothetical protein
MPPTNPTSEEVVEKKASAPVTTACLIIACIALLGGIIFQVMEITEYRSGAGDPKDQASKRYKTDIKNLKEAVEETLSKATVGAVPEEGAVAPTDTAPVTPTDTAPVTPTDTAPVTPTEAAPAETPPDEATPAADAGDTKTPPAGDEPKDATEGDAEK